MNRIDQSRLEGETQSPLGWEQFIRGPDFRWQIADKLADHDAADDRLSSWHPSSLLPSDEPIRQAADFLRSCRQFGRERAARFFPTIARADQLAHREEEFGNLKLCLLGDLPSGEIAERLGCQRQEVRLSELLFFDINGHRQASSWLSSQVFVPEAKFGSKERAAKLSLALHGGPVVTRALLDGQQRLPLSEGRRLIVQELQLFAKLQAALACDLDTSSAERFLKLYYDYDLKRRKLQLECEKFQVACADAVQQQSAQRQSSDQPGDSGRSPGATDSHASPPPETGQARPSETGRDYPTDQVA